MNRTHITLTIYRFTNRSELARHARLIAEAEQAAAALHPSALYQVAPDFTLAALDAIDRICAATGSDEAPTAFTISPDDMEASHAL